MKILIVVIGALVAGVAVDDPACDMKTPGTAKVCSNCEEINPKADEEGGCCGQAPNPREVCIKTYYECSTCFKKQFEDTPCCEGSTNKKFVIRAIIRLKCEGCGAVGRREGDCISKVCRAAGKKVRKFCDQSGTWPHGGKMPDGKTPEK